MDVSSVDSIDSVEPFGEVFIPWMYSEDAEIKRTMEVFEPTTTISKQYPDKKIHLDEFLKATYTKGNTPEEKKAAHPECPPKYDDRRIFLKGKRTPKQYKLNNCVPSSENSVQGPSVSHDRAVIDSVDRTQRQNSPEFVTGINEVIPFSNEFSTFEKNIEHLIAELDSKTRSAVKLQSKQRSPVEKVLQFKLKDSKLISNNSGFIDSISVEIKLNKEQLMSELVNGELFKPQQSEEENTTETSATENDRLKKLTCQKLNQQRNAKSVAVLDGKKNVSHDKCKETKSYGAEFTKYSDLATQRWISDLLKSIGGIEKIRDLTENDQSKNRDIARKKGRSQREEKTDSLAPSLNRPLHGTPIEASSLMNRHITSKPKTRESPKIALSQSVVKGSLHLRNNNSEIPRAAKNVSFSHKGQQRKAERDVRIALWQERNGCLRDTLQDRNSDLINDKTMEDGLVGRSSRYMKEEHFEVI